MKAYFFAIFAVCCWGTMATATKLLISGLTSLQVLAYASLFAAGFLIMGCRLRKTGLKKPSMREILSMSLIGFLGISLYNLLLYIGIDRLPAQTAFVINYLWPACVILFGFILLKEKLTAGKLCALLLTCLGVIVNTVQGSLSFFENLDFVGVLSCAMAAISYGLYSVLNKMSDYDRMIGLCIAYGECALLSFILIGLTNPADLILNSLTELIGLFFVGIICNAASYLAWVRALDLGDTTVISTLAYLTPAVSLIVTHLILGDSITVWSVLGIGIILFGIVLQIVLKEKKM